MPLITTKYTTYIAELHNAPINDKLHGSNDNKLRSGRDPLYSRLYSALFTVASVALCVFSLIEGMLSSIAATSSYVLGNKVRYLQLKDLARSSLFVSYWNVLNAVTTFVSIFMPTPLCPSLTHFRYQIFSLSNKFWGFFPLPSSTDQPLFEILKNAQVIPFPESSQHLGRLLQKPVSKEASIDSDEKENRYTALFSNKKYDYYPFEICKKLLQSTCQKALAPITLEQARQMQDKNENLSLWALFRILHYLPQEHDVVSKKFPEEKCTKEDVEKAYKHAREILLITADEDIQDEKGEGHTPASSTILRLPESWDNALKDQSKSIDSFTEFTQQLVSNISEEDKKRLCSAPALILVRTLLEQPITQIDKIQKIRDAL